MSDSKKTKETIKAYFYIGVVLIMAVSVILHYIVPNEKVSNICGIICSISACILLFKCLLIQHAKEAEKKKTKENKTKENKEEIKKEETKEAEIIKEETKRNESLQNDIKDTDTELKEADIESEKTVAEDKDDFEISDEIKSRFEYMQLLADILEENDIDNFKFPKPTTYNAIKSKEHELEIQLPEEYKSYIMLSNGFRDEGSEIYPINRVEQFNVPGGWVFNGYYAIGEYIGDGSLILCDSEGKVYYGDHAYNEVEETTFGEFIDEQIIRNMIDSCRDNNVEIPERV